ncbi:unnamed protein product [Effrenium voratum]|uniref:Nudix hydrolase domain-containing protein n=1 Tax=Effrenium voratum TaxID=2562239 RepID=A0AA36J396_9DINO|nr:unnamed protein product [Effrenium voratum]CAJ1398324.1 unnamed protein product [Effrenium voratum]CAJ1428762.1 unnamed protein product [Effrenium voratum]
MQQVPHFVTGNFKPHHLFLEDAEYGRALDTLVKAVSDVLITSCDRSRVFLGRRKVHPQPDWWLMGGRSRPGESPVQAAARNVRRELGLNLPVSRFEVIGCYSMTWAMRVQAPADHGTADISALHQLVLQPEEEAAIKVDDKEYWDLRWFDKGEILAGEFHPVLKQGLRDLHARNLYKSLEQAACQESKDAELAALAREFVAAAKESRAMSTQGMVQVDFDEENRRYDVSFHEVA